MLNHLPADIQQRIQLRLASGTDSSHDDILRRALDALDWQDEERIAIQQGIDDV